MTSPSTLAQALGLPELVKLCAVDSALYCKTFFPNTFRQPSPLFHKDIFALLENPAYRHVAIKVFRGGAKTTLLRAYASKRIAYGTSRTIMLVGLSQDHAKYSLGWLKNQVDRNRAWTQVFGIERGRKWTDEVAEIYLRTLGHTATVIAVGITGQTRGINVDDYRPDLIVVDDPCHLAGTSMYHEGRWFSVEDHPRAHIPKLAKGLSVFLDGLPEPEIVTQDHKYWASKALWTRQDRLHHLKITDLQEPDWVQASELTTEHYIGMPVPETAPPEWPKAEMRTPEFWYLVGLWWGDGSLGTSGNQVKWSISNQGVLNRVTAYCTKLGWKFGIDKGTGCCSLRVGVPWLHKWLMGWKRGNSRKEPPVEVLGLTDLEHYELILGYLDADGCVNGEGTGMRLVSIHLPGLLMVSWILAKLGIRSTIRKTHQGGLNVICGREVTAQVRYDLGFTDCAELFREGLDKAKRHFTKCILKDGFIWRRVRLVVDAGMHAFVPLTTEDGTYLTAFGRSANCNEENSATPEQRAKTGELVHGALDKSLAPASEAPDAKMALLGTPLDGEDIVEQCVADPEWASRVYGCFGEDGQSAWAERFPTEELRKDKAAHIEKGQQYLLLWLREMECTVVGGAAARFKLGWLKYWDVMPEEPLAVAMGIDPAPPPSDRQIMKGLMDKDSEVLSIVGATKGNLMLLDYSESRGHTPEWTTAEFFRLLDRWRPIKVRIEGIAYQRTLKWILEKAMKERGRYVQVDAVADRRSKELRIDQALSGPASQGRLFVHKSHTSFLEQFGAFPKCKRDDVLDGTAMAVEAVGSEGYYGASLAEASQEALPEGFGRWAP